MSIRSINLRHIWIIALYNVRFVIRRGGAITFFVISLLTVLGISSLFFTGLEAFAHSQEGAPMITPALLDMFAQSEDVVLMVDWLLGAEGQGDHLLRQKPALLSIIYLWMAVFLPYLICLGSFNQTSGDINNKGLRFLLLRTERVNIFVGRMLGTLAFCVSTVIFTVALLVAYIHFKIEVYELSDLLHWGMHGSLLFIILCLPFVAMAGCISAFFKKPILSLIFSVLAVSVVSFFLWKLGSAFEQDWVSKLWPTGWKYQLFFSGEASLVAVAVMLGFTLAFTIAGVKILEWRDL